MRALHIAPGDSAGGSLRCAVRDAGCDDDVLSWRDDLSCGPIASGEASERAEWWSRFYDDRDIAPVLKSFWDRVADTNDRLVVWFGRHCASELAFFLAWTYRLGDRPFEYIDVTGRQFPRQSNPSELGPPMRSVGIMNPEMLKSLLGREQIASASLKEEAVSTWRRLRAENAPFRVVTASGLASAPADYFDPLILEQATTEWRSVTRVIAATMGRNYEPYMQVRDVMLQARIVALVEDGKLIADGDPWDRRSGRIRLPG